MPGSLVHRTSGTVSRPTGAPRQQAGLSASTSDVTFDAPIPTWNDLPEETRHAAHWGTPVVAEQVERLTRGALKVEGVLHQRTVGWRAHLDRIVVATAVRPLRKRPDGRMAPAGPWRHHDVAVHLPTGPVRQRDGVVPVDHPSPTGDAAQDSAPRLPVDQQAASSNCAYLPTAVQQGLFDAVPDPSLWLGELVQSTEDGYPVHHKLTSLRVGERRAVALVAERRLPATRSYRVPGEAVTALASTPWNVMQYTYDIDGPDPSRGALDCEGRR